MSPAPARRNRLLRPYTRTQAGDRPPAGAAAARGRSALGPGPGPHGPCRDGRAAAHDGEPVPAVPGRDQRTRAAPCWPARCSATTSRWTRPRSLRGGSEQGRHGGR
ncbi:hypothetical protein QJS66_05605 [Kocuria rhizophila]|nr:hypothetical protein QJS66_05605 [Kocuria rhizophila]